MLDKKFGIEVEFTGITRAMATAVVAKVVNGEINLLRDYYDTSEIKAPDGRKWKVLYDGSIEVYTTRNGSQLVRGTRENSCELVSPILTYNEDIETVQTLVRELKKVGAVVNSSCGIHIHLNGEDHTPTSIRNFVNIIASKNDLFYNALEIERNRMRFCMKLDNLLVAKLNKKSKNTFAEIEEIWYAGCDSSRTNHYNDTRYHFLNLHSFFHGHKTVELRGFNSTLHAGKVRSYIVLALALNNQALTQKSASSKKPQVENEKFAMRTYLNRIGMIGEEFKNCRVHLCKALNGSSAWRFGADAPRHA